MSRPGARLDVTRHRARGGRSMIGTGWPVNPGSGTPPYFFDA